MKELEALLRELVEHGEGYISAIELGPGLDGEDWWDRVKKALEEIDE